MNQPLVLLLCAGLGTRLGKLTSNQPKPLVPIGDGRLIDCALWQLRQAGLSEVVVNLFYLGEMIADYLGDGSNFGLNISYSNENPILDTGGAILHVMNNHSGRDVLVFNSDSVFDKSLELREFISSFYKDNAGELPIASMLLSESRVSKSQPYSVSAYCDLDGQLHLARVLNAKTKLPPSVTLEEYEFTGVQLISHRAHVHMAKLGPVFSSTKDLYPIFINEGMPLRAMVHKGFWKDTGTQDRLAEVVNAVKLGIVGT